MIGLGILVELLDMEQSEVLHCAFSTTEAARIRLQRLRSLHALLHAEAG